MEGQWKDRKVKEAWKVSIAGGGTERREKIVKKDWWDGDGGTCSWEQIWPFEEIPEFR